MSSIFGCGQTTQDDDQSYGSPTPSPTPSNNAPTSCPFTPTPSPTPVPNDSLSLSEFNTVSIPGELQTLIQGDHGCYAISTIAGTYEKPARTLFQFVPDNGTVSPLQDLPNADKRSYGWSIPLSNGNFAFLYQSTASTSFDSQDGTHQGVLITDANGNVLADHDLYQSGVTRPSAIAEYQGHLIVLANNGDTVSSQNNTVDFPDYSSLVIIDNPLATNVDNYRIVDLDTYVNASSMVINGNELWLAAADNAVSDEAQQGKALTLNVDDLVSTGKLTSYSSVPLLQGVGLSGNAALGEKGVLFTGQQAEQKSIAAFDGRNPPTYFTLPSNFNQQYIPYATYINKSGSTAQGIAFDFSANGTSYYYLLDPVSQKMTPFDAMASAFPASILHYGVDQYCSGAADSDIDTSTGDLKSSVVFYESE